MRTCKIDGCDRTFKARGYCNTHYRRLLEYGDPRIDKRIREQHGMSKSENYGVYRDMIDRCYNENNAAYRHYGGRGIAVCEEWRHSFTTFNADMGKRPHPKMELDRIDNNGGYSKDNCRWVTHTQNARNTRRVKLSPYLVRVIRELGGRGIGAAQISRWLAVKPETIKAATKYRSWRNI